MNTDVKNKIQLALEKLLQRENEDSFVIIEDTKTGKFVQFGGGKYEELFFDIPQQILNKQEKERADEILKAYDIFYGFHNIYDENNSEIITGKEYGFSKELDNNIPLAIELVEKIMDNVFLITDIQLEITEN